MNSARTLVVLLLLAQGAYAAGSCEVGDVTTAAAARARFETMRIDQCLGGSMCTSELCASVTRFEARNRSDGEDAARFAEKSAEAAAILLAKVRDSAADLPPDGVAVGQLLGMFDRWSGRLFAGGKALSPIEVSRSITTEWEAPGFLVFQGTPFEVDLEDALLACRSPAECKAAVASAAAVHTDSRLVYRVLQKLLEPQFAAVGKMLTTFDQRWTAFHNESRAIYPWELALNNAFYKGAAAGFSGPPNYQVLFLHPSVGVVFDDSAEDKLQEAIIMDLLGFYRWRWGGENDAEISHPWGLSVAAAWSGEDPGFGFAFHMPRNWSAAITMNRHSNVQLLLSVDLGNYVMSKKNDVAEIRGRLEKLHSD